MTVAELVNVLMRYDGDLPVYAPNWHEEYGEVKEETINCRDYHWINGHEIKAVTIVGKMGY